MNELKPQNKTGWHIFQVLVVLIIVAVLAGMILPVIGMNTHGHSRQSMCGKNQSQVYGALIAYSTEFEVTYPGPIDPSIGPITDAHRARQVTHQMFWLLARQQRLPTHYLTCPKSTRPKLDKIDGERPPPTWGMEPGSAVHAFDWASPADPSSARIVMADRDQGAHEGRVMAVFGDAHVKAIPVVEGKRRTVGILITEGPDGKPLSGATVMPVDDREDEDKSPPIPDDIYTNEHDGVYGFDALSQGKAHNMRVWVK